MSLTCHCESSFSGHRMLHHRSNQFAAPSMRLAARHTGCRASRQTAPVTSARQQMLVHVPPHPLIKHWLAVARSKDKPSCLDIPVETPVGKADATIIDPASPVKLIPVMRAGMVLLDQASSTLPMSETYHVGLERDERTLRARWYLNKMPRKFKADDRILILDPMLATGGTMETVIEEVLNHALRRLSPNYPGLNVYAAMIDSELDRQGFIVPGLGDAGDRAFGSH
ncbi:hypothetical protein WJX84_003240 [Apatococcus fuscideae]|uniref:uracil phosphoribosyltransferase n=1 Tax=Apatococcus fuscideae TaxID=2026836 RepID=A0AAW1SPA0_9CHLO